MADAEASRTKTRLGDLLIGFCHVLAPLKHVVARWEQSRLRFVVHSNLAGILLVEYRCPVVKHLLHFCFGSGEGSGSREAASNEKHCQ